MAEKHKAHVAPKKKEVVKKLNELFKKFPIIAIANMENLSSTALQKMRKQLRGKAEIYMTKSNLMNLSIDASKNQIPGIEKLAPLVSQGMPSFLFTKENPFSIYKLIKKSKTQAAAKPGQVAPINITIPKGPTPFTPGPVISELSQLGIKAGVEAGKIVVKEDKLVVKEGEVINGLLASMLARLGIKPMEIGLNIVGVLEKGVLYDKSVLDIDEKSFIEKIIKAVTHARNLSVESAYPTKQNRELLIQKAFKNAKAVALAGGILAKGIVEDVLAKANAQMIALKSLIKE